MAAFEMHRYAGFIFPFWVTYPTDWLETNVTANAWVPIDDEHTMIFNIDWMRAHGQRLSRHARGGDVAVPAGTDWLDPYRAALVAIHGEESEVMAT